MVHILAMLAVAGLGAVGCGCEQNAADPPIPGIVDPAALDERTLLLSNRSAGYVVYRLTTPQAGPLVTPPLPPGGDFVDDVGERFGTLCPETIEVEIFAYLRQDESQPALADERLKAAPIASARFTLQAGQGFGCQADIASVSLTESIVCTVWEADAQTSAIGYETDQLVPRRQVGLNAGDPPALTEPQRIPLAGRVVNLDDVPLPGVEIRLGDLGESVWTGDDGQFSVPRPIGSYLVEAVIPGVEVTPPLSRYTHRSSQDIPIEFIALTHDIPAAAPAGE